MTNIWADFFTKIKNETLTMDDLPIALSSPGSAFLFAKYTKGVNPNFVFNKILEDNYSTEVLKDSIDSFITIDSFSEKEALEQILTYPNYISHIKVFKNNFKSQECIDKIDQVSNMVSSCE